jgi:hypothetical protein
MKDSTIAILAGIGVGGLILYKSNFFQNISTGAENLLSEFGNIGTGAGNLLSSTGAGIFEIGAGVEQIGAGTGKGLAEIGGGIQQIGTGTGEFLSGSQLSQIINALEGKNPPASKIPAPDTTITPPPTPTGTTISEQTQKTPPPTDTYQGNDRPYVAPPTPSTPVSQTITTASKPGSASQDLFNPVGSLLSGSYGNY